MLTGLSTLTTPPTLAHAADPRSVMLSVAAWPRLIVVQLFCSPERVPMYALPNDGPSFGLLPRPTTTVSGSPSRDTTRVTTSLGSFDWICRTNCSAEVIAVPSTDTMTSPGWTPAASAGPPATTSEKAMLPLGSSLPFDRVDAEQQADRDEHVHQRSGGDDQHPARIGLIPVRPGLVSRIDLVEVVHADDPHERADRIRTDAVLGLATPEAPQLRAHEEEELCRLHPGPSGGHEVTELVQEDATEEQRRQIRRPRGSTTRAQPAGR